MMQIKNFFKLCIGYGIRNPFNFCDDYDNIESIFYTNYTMNNINYYQPQLENNV